MPETTGSKRPVRRLFRATARYLDHEVTRHFQTKRARGDWATQRALGYEPEPGIGLDDDGRPGIPPALEVRVSESEPITFGDERPFTISCARSGRQRLTASLRADPLVVPNQ